ncbi:MAG: ABC transporter permease [Ancalomicrobiaceae bacterium]|nr:ABC transporter permease [Ancalomicrobiaceae bacterium]
MSSFETVEPTLADEQQAIAGHRSVRALRTVLARLELSLVIAWATIAIAVAFALVPFAFTRYSAVDGLAAERRMAPGIVHWLGTDELGRDLYARIVYGSVQTLSGALIAVGVGLVVGTFLGVVAGSSRRRLDDAIMRLVDVLLALPPLLLSLSIIILLGFGTVHAAIAVGVTSIARFARLSRAEVVRVRRSDYVEAAFGSGGTFFAVLWRHVLPNSLTSVVGLAALQFGSAILLISTLGFLGFGAPPPTPEWGLLISEGRKYISTAWWMTTFPGIAVVMVVLAANRISRALHGRTS